MFTHKLRKFASKIVMLSMLFSVATPLTGVVSAAPNTDSLQVSFNHQDGGYLVKNIFDQVVADRSASDCQLSGGYYTCDDDFQKGGYTVEFKDVVGYITPADADVTLNGGGIELVGTYVLSGQQQTANLTVGVNHPDAGFKVKNIFNQVVLERSASDCQLNGGYYTCNEELQKGGYTVEFTDVNGYATPADADVTLDKGGSVFGTYLLQQNNTATLNVAVNHNQGGFVIKNIFDQVVVSRTATDCGAKQPNGYYVCEEDLQKGGYTVEFTAVAGYLTPAPKDVTLENGGTVYGTYVVEPEANFATLSVAVNIGDPAGFVIKNIFDQVVVDRDASDCNLQNGWYICDEDLQKGGYTVEFKDAPGYITPSDVDVTLNMGGTVWGFYSQTPAGVVEVQVVDENNVPILDLPQDEWELHECASANPQSCYATTGSGGQGDVFADQAFANYRIVFPNPEPPAGYTGRTVLPSIEQDLDANHTYILFTIKYTTGGVVIPTDVAYVNVQTTPVSAQTRMVTLDPPQPNQMEVTTHEINPTLFDIDPANYYTLPTGQNGMTAPTDYYIECLPAPGGYHAPVNPAIVKTDVIYAKQSVNLAGTCTYTAVPPNEKVTIYIDTIGVTDAEIRVDNVVVRDKGDDNLVPVEITTTEQHTINWTDENGFVTPEDIAIPANSLNSNMAQDELTFLGYYVAIGNLAQAYVNTENQDGWVYITIGNDPFKWNVGHADTTATPLIVHFDETVNHEFHFEDKNNDNPSFYLRAVPAVPGDGFTVEQDVQLNGNDVTYFQENYQYTAPHDIDVVNLVGDYIAESDAAFFRAKTTNAAPVSGEIYLDINGDPTETLNPGANTFTRIFISDVANDQDTTSFESPINVQNCNWTATPQSYDLSNYNPSPTINDLLSTYICGGNNTYDVVVQLISMGNPIVLPVGDVVMDNVDHEQAVDNNGTPEATFSDVDNTVDHNVVCPDIAGFQSPNTVNIPADTLQQGTNIFACVYTPIANSAEILIETEAVNKVNFAAPIILNVDGQLFNLGFTDDSIANVPASMHLWIDTTANNTIIYGNMPPYITPASEVIPANTLVPGSSYQDAQYAASNSFYGFYDLAQANVTFNVSTQDDKGTALTEDITHGPTGTETTVATPTSFAVAPANLNTYTINFADKAGYIKPGPVVVTNGQINALPAHVTITHNGSAYVLGTPLVPGDTYVIVGTYTPFFHIEKKIVSEQTIVNNNKRVDYQIVITRDPDAQGGPMTITMHDSLSDNNRTLIGSNGGTMTTVPQNGQHSVCSNNCGDITAGSIPVTIDNPGNSVTITYQLLSDNTGIPANQTSTFTNTLTGTYMDNGQQVQVTTNASVTVSAKTTTPPCVGFGCGVPSGGGGGGGGGGGNILITGDMVLEITKMVSLDKINWYDASDPDSPLNIPKHVDSKLYNRVTVKNLGQVTAKSIVFTEDFDQLDSRITSDDIRNVQGDGVTFEDATNKITIDEIFVGGEKEFTYEQLLHEGGANGELAEEFLVLESFSTKLPKSQDGLTKHGVGEHYSSWLIAGTTTVVTSEGSLLELTIRTDKAAASPGEEVTYTITAKNNADFDFTGMIVTWDYDEDCLEILNPFGGRDTGTEIHWDRGILRPGESVQYQVRTRVKACGTSRVRTTARGLVSELENPAAVEHFLTIIAGITDVPKLAQTGLGNTGLLLIASILAYFGYTRTGNRRYLALKRKALRPL